MEKLLAINNECRLGPTPPNKELTSIYTSCPIGLKIKYDRISSGICSNVYSTGDTYIHNIKIMLII